MLWWVFGCVGLLDVGKFVSFLGMNKWWIKLILGMLKSICLLIGNIDYWLNCFLLIIW